MKKRDLQQKRADLIRQESELLELAVSEERGLSEAENKLSGERTAEIEKLGAQVESIENAEVKLRQMRNLDERLEQATAIAARVSTDRGDSRRAEAGPFLTLGEQLQAAWRYDQTGGRDLDQKLAATGMGEAVGSEGGFLVQKDFSTALLERSGTEAVLATRCTRMPIGPTSNGLKAPYVDETSRVTGSRWGGVTIYRAAEGIAPTSARAKLGRWELDLEKLIGLVYVTEELMQDAVALNAFTSQAFGEEFAYVLDDEILNGTGVGKCLGIMNSPALVSVAKETAQAAATIVPENVTKMYSRCLGRFRSNSVWLINQDVEPQLFLMKLPVGTGGQPVFMPPNGLSGSPFATLYGRPLIPIEQCATLGTKGDIVLADLSQYVLIEKGGLQAASSIHVRFINDETAFRFTMRVNGQPKWKTALTPAKGTNTLSPFVSLDTRA